MLILWANLDRRPDRRKFMEDQLDRYGIDAHRIAAIDGYSLKPSDNILPTGLVIPENDDPGGVQIMFGSNQFACTATMGLACHIAKMYEQPYFLYLEDDAILVDRLEEFINLYMKKIPDDWDVFNFGALTPVGQPRKAINKLVAEKTTNVAWTTHMILFRDTAYDKVIKHVGTGLPCAADVVLFSAPDIKIYIMTQEAHFLQKEGYSDISHQHLGLDNARTDIYDLYKKMEEAHREDAKPC